MGAAITVKGASNVPMPAPTAHQAKRKNARRRPTLITPRQGIVPRTLSLQERAQSNMTPSTANIPDSMQCAIMNDQCSGRHRTPAGWPGRQSSIHPSGVVSAMKMTTAAPAWATSGAASRLSPIRGFEGLPSVSGLPAIVSATDMWLQAAQTRVNVGVWRGSHAPPARFRSPLYLRGQPQNHTHLHTNTGTEHERDPGPLYL